MSLPTNKYWIIWKHALGTYSEEDIAGHEDAIVIIRSIILTINLLCAFLIMINIVIGWL